MRRIISFFVEGLEIETELPKIIRDLNKYNQDINLLIENVEW
jgi:hypothetical protein